MSTKQNDSYEEQMAEMANDKDVDETLAKAIPVEPEKPEQPMYTHIDAYYKGFHTEFVIPSENGSIHAGKVVIAIESLLAKGFLPSWNHETNKVSLKPEVKDVTETAKAPKCSIHGIPMIWKSGTAKATGKPYAFWACNEKLADGSWCNGKAMKE